MITPPRVRPFATIPTLGLRLSLKETPCSTVTRQIRAAENVWKSQERVAGLRGLYARRRSLTGAGLYREGEIRKTETILADF
jgi:hypothetical protein